MYSIGLEVESSYGLHRLFTNHEIRWNQDKYIIKWVSIGEEEQHLICKLHRNATTSREKTSYSLVRQQPTSNEGFALLQSMLYHTQQITTHYWLTPLLAYIHANPGDMAQHYTYLQHLDNHLLSSTETGTLPKRSWQFLQEPWKLSEMKDIATFLRESLGVKFPHYWFYKLEFILWFGGKVDGIKIDGIKEVRSTFRITAKNSVEHIAPQTAQAVDTNTVSDAILDSFGNLALVSRGVNSEFGNRPFHGKRAHFLSLCQKNARVDSLKMALIYYHNTVWNDDTVRQHQDQMIECVTNYLRQSVNYGASLSGDLC